MPALPVLYSPGHGAAGAGHALGLPHVVESGQRLAGSLQPDRAWRALEIGLPGHPQRQIEKPSPRFRPCSAALRAQKLGHKLQRGAELHGRVDPCQLCRCDVLRPGPQAQRLIRGRDLPNPRPAEAAPVAQELGPRRGHGRILTQG